MKSKYIVFPDKQSVEVWEEEIGDLEAGEILCQAERSLISIGTELHCLRGQFDPGTNWFDWVKYPFRTGYSMVGKVLAVAPDVQGIRVGDRIASYSLHQQYYKVQVMYPEKRYDIPVGIGVYVMPEDISSEAGTWRSLGVTTQSAVRRAEFQFGESAAVIGLGTLGQLVVQYLVAAGAREIVAIDPMPTRVELAKANGATHGLAVPVQDATDYVSTLTNGWGLDAVFEVTGHPSALAPSIQLLRRLGRLVLLGDSPVPTQQVLGPGVVFKSVSILGIHGYQVPDKKTEYTPWSVDAMSDLFFEYLRHGKMNVTSLVTHRYSPDQAAEAYLGLLKDRSNAVGVIFDWER
jgi:2-desacetyl-2-hydroxyethyl bacteriochlorophyllide A dehydrogenase